MAPDSTKLAQSMTVESVEVTTSSTALQKSIISSWLIRLQQSEGLCQYPSPTTQQADVVLKVATKTTLGHGYVDVGTRICSM